LPVVSTVVPAAAGAVEVAVLAAGAGAALADVAVAAGLTVGAGSAAGAGAEADATAGASFFAQASDTSPHTINAGATDRRAFICLLLRLAGILPPEMADRECG